MDESRVEAVGEDGHDLDDGLDEVGSAFSVPAGGQLDADLELGDGHGCHGDVVEASAATVAIISVGRVAVTPSTWRPGPIGRAARVAR